MNVGSASAAPSLAIAGMRSEQQQQLVTAQGAAANLQSAGQIASSGSQQAASQQGQQPDAPQGSGRGTNLDISV